MATSKTRSTTSTRKTAPAKATPAKSRATKADKSLLARAGSTIKDRPYASAAIATGAVTAVAAAAAGAYFFSRSNKSVGQTADELGTRVKDGLAEVSDKARDLTKRAKKSMGFEESKTQAEIAEEALTLKDTGQATTTPASELAN